MTKHSPGNPDNDVASDLKLSFSLPEFWRFLFVGLVNAIAGFLLFLLFFGLFGWHYLISNVLVFSSWAWFGYQLQRRWVFRIPSSPHAFLKYVVNQIGFMVSGTAVLWLLVEFATLRPEAAYLITVGLITLGVYLSSKFWVFRR